jgi:hypothetical protein
LYEPDILCSSHWILDFCGDFMKFYFCGTLVVLVMVVGTILSVFFFLPDFTSSYAPIGIGARSLTLLIFVLFLD